MKQTKNPSDSAEEKAISPKIDLEEIARLVNFLEEKKLTGFELEVEGFKIKISRGSPPVAQESRVINPGVQAEKEAFISMPDASTAAAQSGLHFIASPMVGMFYRASDPNSTPFVEVGDPVKKNQTLCIIEAMKLMNEIEADVDGIIKEVYVENAKPVEYGQKLFAILPAT